jgi:glycosyltransferase involved in cell wall biosynthesis
LVFLTKVGVGYGHVNIEASLCGLPIVAYNPGGDVEWLLGDSCTRDVDAIADRIIRGEYLPLVLPTQFDESFIREETLKVFRAAWA